MKTIARSYFWWTKQLKSWESHVNPVKLTKPFLLQDPYVHPWIWPHTPWKHIHVDFVGPYLGHMLFIVADAHLKWPEVKVMSTTTLRRQLKSFCSPWAPRTISIDNGLQFTSTNHEMNPEG